MFNDFVMLTQTFAIELFGCPIHALTMDETVKLIDRSIRKKEPVHHVVVNAAKLVNMQKDPLLRQAVVNSDLINADGQAVVWAARWLGKYLPERVAGIDLMQRLVALAHQRHYRIFFFGAEEAVVRKVAEHYSGLYSPDIVAGYRNGYYSKAEEAEVAKAIAESKPDLIFVAMTSPKKEIFLDKYKSLIRSPFVMGVGGSFDIVAGKTKRAPLWMQKGGLEWLFRVIQEPRRMWKRYLVTNTKFIWMMLVHKLGWTGHSRASFEQEPEARFEVLEKI